MKGVELTTASRYAERKEP